MNQQGASKQPQEPTRWELMARERNARVVMCNTPDTYCLTDLARFADRSVRALRNRLLITLTPEQVLPLLQEYKDAVLTLHKVVEKMCDMAEMDYRVPRSVKRLIGENGDSADETPAPAPSAATESPKETKKGKS